MSNTTQQAFGWRQTGRGALSAMLVLGLSTLTACKDLLDVDNEGEILDGDLSTVQAIAPVVAGVAGDFGAMYSQNASTVAVAAFELWHTGSFPASRQTDEGFLKRPSADGNSAYNALARSYWVAQDAVRRVQEAFADSANRRAELAEVITWGAYTLHFMADNFCGATFDGGPAVTPDAVRRKAEEDFTRAITVATAANNTTW